MGAFDGVTDFLFACKFDFSQRIKFSSCTNLAKSPSAKYEKVYKRNPHI